MTDGYACCAYDMTRVPDQEAKKYDWGEGRGAQLIGLPSQQLYLLLPHHWPGDEYFYELTNLDKRTAVRKDNLCNSKFQTIFLL